VRLSVAPSLRLSASTDHTSVSGTVRPFSSAVPVQVQRQGTNGTWTTVAQATPASDGSFQAVLNLVPGAYRARIVPGNGFAPGVSPVLTVVPA
jgi:hypothetical protein